MQRLRRLCHVDAAEGRTLSRVDPARGARLLPSGAKIRTQAGEMNMTDALSSSRRCASLIKVMRFPHQGELRMQREIIVITSRPSVHACTSKRPAQRGAAYNLMHPSDVQLYAHLPNACPAEARVRVVLDARCLLNARVLPKAQPTSALLAPRPFPTLFASWCRHGSEHSRHIPTPTKLTCSRPHSA